MANSFTTSFVSTPIDRLFEELVLPMESFEKNIAQVIPGYQKQVTMNRFFADGNIEAYNSTFGAGTAGDLIKNEKQIVMQEMQQEYSFDPKEFNLDWKFLWQSGPSAELVPSPALMSAVMSTVGKRFNANLEQAAWNGFGTLTGWAADIAAVDARGNVIAVTPAGAITPANVLATLDAVIAAATPEMKELGNPTIVTTHAVKYAYREASVALPYKGVDLTQMSPDVYQGYNIVSTAGVPANNIYFLNASSGDDGALKSAIWADSDRFYIRIAPTGNLDDTLGIKIAFNMGTQTLLNGQIVSYLPA